MAKKAKKLQELKNIFKEIEINFELLEDVTVLKELKKNWVQYQIQDKSLMLNII